MPVARGQTMEPFAHPTWLLGFGILHQPSAELAALIFRPKGFGVRCEYRGFDEGVHAGGLLVLGEAETDITSRIKLFVIALGYF